MKILYIGNFTEKDSPLGYCPNAKWISDTFKDLGHKVMKLNECDQTAISVITRIESWKPDLILTEEGRLNGDFINDDDKDIDIIKGKFKRVMRVAKNNKIPVVAWLTNIFYGIMRREIQVTQNPIFRADIVFTTDGGHDKEFKRDGVNHHLLRQGIYEPESYISYKKHHIKAEIVFIGSIYENIWPYRQKLVDWLREEYRDNFAHIGERGEIRHDELNDLCSTAKIVVGDSVISKNYWSNRVYEIIGRGGFLIMPKIEGLEKEFTPFKHYIPYRLGDFDQLKEIIDYYLTHHFERNNIRKAGQEYCKKHHTYQIRVKELLKTLHDEKILRNRSDR